jgi:hypothetical protein
MRTCASEEDRHASSRRLQRELHPPRPADEEEDLRSYAGVAPVRDQNKPCARVQALSDHARSWNQLTKRPARVGTVEDLHAQAPLKTCTRRHR